jgi:hypothetical protein
MPDFSSWKLAIQVLQSGCVTWRQVSNEWGHSHLRLTALTKLADAGLLCGGQGRWNEKDWWPGIRMPSMHKSCHVIARFGRGMPY